MARLSAQRDASNDAELTRQRAIAFDLGVLLSMRDADLAHYLPRVRAFHRGDPDA